MKKYIMIISIVLSQIAIADEFIQMNNGMTCWRNDSGHVYGCSGGVDTGDSGFNDVNTGRRYNYSNPNQAIDSRTGMPLNTPYRNRYYDD